MMASNSSRYWLVITNDENWDLIQKNNIVDFHDTKIRKIKIFGKIIHSQKVSQCSKYDYVIITTDHSDLNKKVILSKSKKIFDTRGTFGKVKSKKVVSL